MSRIAARLQELGLTLPQPPQAVASYVPARQAGRLLLVSGQLPFRDGELLARGRVPEQVSLEEAQACARQCALNGLAVASAALEGDLDRIEHVARVGCFVASTPEFFDQPKVANGASDLLVEVFGDAGRHARAAVGSVALPLGAPVEVEFLFKIA